MAEEELETRREGDAVRRPGVELDRLQVDRETAEMWSIGMSPVNDVPPGGRPITSVITGTTSKSPPQLDWICVRWNPRKSKPAVDAP